jgi:hypothetical protein
MSGSSVQIVKVCGKKDETVEHNLINENEIKVAGFAFQGNFLQTIDDEILFFDDTIGIKDIRNVSVIQEILDLPQCIENKSNLIGEIVDNIFSSAIMKKQPEKLFNQISLPIENVNEICFNEMLIVSEHINPSEFISMDDFQVGSANVSIKQLQNENFMIFLSEKSFIDGVSEVKEIFSIVTRDLKLIREKILEAKYYKGQTEEKTLDILVHHDSIQMKKSISFNQKSDFYRCNLKWNKTGDFLSHGATILMLRYLSSINFNGDIEAFVCDVDGNIGLSYWKFNSKQVQRINDQDLYVQEINEWIDFNDKCNLQNSYAFLPKSGHLLKKITNKCNLIIHVNPLKTNFSKEYTFENELELLSSYLNLKAKRNEKMRIKKSYILKSYVRNLYLQRPRDIMNFTLEFINCKNNIQNEKYSKSAE